MSVILQPPSLLSLSLIAVCSITLAVQPLPPRVTRPPTIVPDPNLDDIVYFDTEGEHPTELPCQALGSSPMKYLWTKNGDPLDVNDPKYISNTTKISKIVLKNANKGTIQMTELKEDDEGIYQCKAENRYGVSKSKTITLEKATKKSFAEFSEKTYKKPVGSFLKMECNAPDNNPPSKKRWLKYSFQGESQQYLDLNKRIAVDFDGNLYFANVQKIDENGNEKYACECSLQSLVGIKIEGAYSYIKVDNSKTGPRNVQQQFPTELQYNSPTKVTALKGESFMLKCIFSGNPTPDIEWRRIKGGQIDTDRMVQRNQNFLVRDVGYADEGTYECRGSNGVPAGKGPITRRFEVKVEAKPSWISEPVKVDAGVEESAVFECGAAGKPEPKIQWYINGVPIENVKADPRRVLSGGQLNFLKLNQDDAQAIQCNASNKHGYLWADVALSILAYKPEIKIPFTYQKVAEGQTVVLPCETDGKPTPRIYWKRGSQTMEGDRYQRHKTGNLTIYNAEVNDEGFWTCYTENRYGKANVTGELVVREKTRIQIAPSPKEQQTIHGSITSFSCSAMTDQDEMDKLTISWLHNGIPVDLSQKHIYMNEMKGLVINGTSSKDTGNYTCVASNNLDSDKATAKLNVLAPPDPPTDVQFESCLSRSVIVTWKPGRSNFSPITAYYVEYNNSYTPHKWHRGKVVTGNAKTEAKITYSPYANYTFRVIARNEHGDSKPSKYSTAVCSSNPEVPDGHPRNVRTDRSKPGWLIVKWDKMDEIEHNGPGFHYILTIKNDTYSKDHIISNWTETSREFNFGKIFDPYEIYVSAKNSEGEPTVGAQLHIGYTGEAKPLTAPSDLEVVGNETDTMVKLKWKAVDLSPSKIRGIFKGYEIRYWKEGLKDSTEKTIEVPRKAPRDNRVRRVVPSEYEIHEAKGLPPFSNLSFEVVARNTHYISEASNVVNATTEEGVPGPVKSARVILRGAHHFLLEWEPPRDINGVLVGYDIGYQEIDGLRLGDMVEVATYDDPYQSRAYMDKLNFDTEYRISVWAKSRKGRGITFNFDAKTANSGDHLQKPMMEIALIGEDFINVTWSVSQKSDTPAGSYHYVKYRKFGDSDWTVTDNDYVNTWTNISDLVPNTKYEIGVVAVDGKLQQQSQLQKVTTRGDAEPSVNKETSIAQAHWFIAMMVLIAILVLFLIVVCFIKRSRGEKYNVQEREKFGGTDPENPDKDLFNEYPKSGETDPLAAGSPDSFDNEPDKLPGGSETDSMAEYGDVDPSKFNEDGSFIGQYGTGGKAEEKGNQPSAMSTFV